MDYLVKAPSFLFLAKLKKRTNHVDKVHNCQVFIFQWRLMRKGCASNHPWECLSHDRQASQRRPAGYKPHSGDDSENIKKKQEKKNKNWTSKAICVWYDRAKGSIICFACSRKFTSDGLATGTYPLPARLPATAEDSGGARKSKEEPKRTRKSQKESWRGRMSWNGQIT